MSDNDDKGKITAEIKTKVKDPKRVEAGKKLAALSKAAREKKKAMIEQPIPGNWNYSIIGIVGIMVAMASLLIAYKSYSRKNVEPEPKLKVEPAPARVSNLENL